MPDSYDGIFVDLVVAGTKVRATDYFQSLEVEIPSEGSWTGSLTLFDPDHSYLDSLIYQAGSTTPIDITFGYANDTAKRVALAGTVLKTGVSFQVEGTELSIEMVARGVVNSVLSKKTRSYSEGQTVSSIVAQIADEEGWSVVDSQGRGTIEETSGVTSESLVSTDDSAIKFVRDQLVPQATNAKNQGDYKMFFDRGGVFHFHTKNFLSPKSKKYVVRRAANGEVVSFEPEDTETFAALLGGGNASFVGVDSGGGSASKTTATAATGVDGGGVATTQGSAYNKPPVAGTAYRKPIISRNSDDAKRRARVFHDAARQMAYTATITVRGTADIEVLDYVDVEVINLDGSTHFLSGQFQATQVTHTVGAEGWSTAVQGVRTGLSVTSTGDAQQVTSTYTPSPSSSGSSTTTITVEES